MARFKKPGWTQFPNEIFDQLMPVLSGAQFKVLMLLIARPRLNLNLIVRGSGITKQGVLNSLVFLSAAGLVRKAEAMSRESAAELATKGNSDPFRRRSMNSCQWCFDINSPLEDHHFPVHRIEGGKVVVRICVSCHREYHRLLRTSYEHTGKVTIGF